MASSLKKAVRHLSGGFFGRARHPFLCFLTRVDTLEQNKRLKGNKV
ncbi:hypothetical protein BAMTA208_13865 [Bacillus amyloliquefaciens TA208]|nr:hypothetical protein BAMTA208_13865 [Bacillus amyloliquefaciens TA208]AEB64442.1 hypothetical protein LL3_02911 [Bacillus amyloliquefaciens LL3]